MKKKVKEKRDGWDKILDFVEKEIELFDKRPKKMRRIHPSGTCYMNDIIWSIQKLYFLNIKKDLKKFARELDKDFMEDTGENARQVILSRLKAKLAEIK